MKRLAVVLVPIFLNSCATTPEEQRIALGQRSPLPEDKKSFTNSLGMKFVYLPPGTFQMGSPTSEPQRDDDETQHRVTLTNGFYIQTTEVTQGQWKAVMGSNPSRFHD